MCTAVLGRAVCKIQQHIWRGCGWILAEIESVASVWRPEIFGARNACTEVRRLEDASILPSSRPGTQAQNLSLLKMRLPGKWVWLIFRSLQNRYSLFGYGQMRGSPEKTSRSNRQLLSPSDRPQAAIFNTAWSASQASWAACPEAGGRPPTARTMSSLPIARACGTDFPSANWVTAEAQAMAGTQPLARNRISPIWPPSILADSSRISPQAGFSTCT